VYWTPAGRQRRSICRPQPKSSTTHSWPEIGELRAAAQNELMVGCDEAAALVLTTVVIDFEDTRIDGLLVESHAITKT
jgi:hypothetical protein